MDFLLLIALIEITASHIYSWVLEVIDQKQIYLT